MSYMLNSRTKTSGFTLVEIAIVLVIFGLLLSAFLAPLTAQRELRASEVTQQSLKLITEAINGFSILNGRLPCPSTQTDPANANYGLEDATCSASYVAEGYLPWRTLGVPEMDEWGTRRTTTGSAWNGYWRYRIDRSFTAVTDFSTNILSATPTYGDTLTIRNSSGNNISSNIERPIAIVYSTGSNLIANGQNATFEATAGIYESNSNTVTFDDMLIWITRPTVVNRMVAAGKLP